MSARLILIAALDDQLGVGKKGSIPWKLPHDMQRFKALTLGGTVCYGRETWQSLPVVQGTGYKYLPHRKNILLTTQCGKVDGMGFTAFSVERALRMTEESERGGPLWVLGGERAWQEAMDMATRDGVPTLMMLTRVAGNYECDRFFPQSGGSWTRTLESPEPIGALSSSFEIWSNF